MQVKKQQLVRTGHGTMDWFQIGKGVHQGYILSPCLYMQSTSYKMLGWMKHKLESKLPDVHLDLEKAEESDQNVNIHWITEKAREFQKNIYFSDYMKTFDSVDHNK